MTLPNPKSPYSRLLFRLAGLQGTDYADIPATELWVVRNIDCYSAANLQGETVFRLQDPLYSNLTVVYLKWDAFAGGGRGWEGRQAFLPGGQLEMTVTGDPTDVSITGFVFAWYGP